MTGCTKVTAGCDFGLADEKRRPGARPGMARFLADRAIDKVRQRFGWEVVGYASVGLGSSRSVPDEFRELAEKELIFWGTFASSWTFYHFR